MTVWSSSVLSFFLSSTKNLILLCLTCSLPFLGLSQIQEKITRLEIQDELTIKQVRSISYPVNTSKPHNLYLHQDWISGWVSHKKDSTVLPIMTRFNILNGAVEVKWREQIRMLRLEDVDVVMIGSRIFLPNKGAPSNYFELLSYGRLHLLCAYELIYSYEGSNVLTTSVNGEKKYNYKPVFFYSKDRKHFSPLKSGKKKILKIMEDNENAKQFIEAENLKLFRKEDLIKLFDFYNGKLKE